MADLSTLKPVTGEVYPQNAIASAFQRLEPMVTAQELRNVWLFGIPLISQIRDPFTGNKPQIMTDEIINEFIKRAVYTIEQEARITIFETMFHENVPFDRADYEAMGYMKLNNRPCSGVSSLIVEAADKSVLFQVPLQWISVSYLTRGQINIIPLNLAISMGGIQNIQSAPGNAIFLSMIAFKPWLSSFWAIEYVAGFPGGLLPGFLNNLIGITAAIAILSALAATFRFNSASLGIDGLSQSVSSQGPLLFQGRIAELQKERDMLMGRVRKEFGTSGFVNSI